MVRRHRVVFGMKERFRKDYLELRVDVVRISVRRG